MSKKTEDNVRDEAKILFGFDDGEINVQQGTGQITTFNMLGLKGSRKPDGWYLPENTANPAIIFEAKGEKENIYLEKWEEEIIKNCRIAKQKYKHVIGVLSNSIDTRVFKDLEEIDDPAEGIQHKQYYLDIYSEGKINKQMIFLVTKNINDCLHFRFGISNLYHRMIFTACALVAERYGAQLQQIKDMGYSTFHTRIHSVLSKSLEQDRQQNSKIDLLLEVYSEVKMNSTDDQEAINDFIDWVTKISDSIQNKNWNGEDVMGIFFNEFNRYKPKTERGQVFTPEHITSLMCRLIQISAKDKVLDAACGSGAFLAKAMSMMIQQAGGEKAKAVKAIKREQLYGIEFDRVIFALVCANMLIHKDGKTNVTNLDSRTDEAKTWIKHAGKTLKENKDGVLELQGTGITKVLMNPPFETKYGCLTIVKNVLDSVPLHTPCAFILPDKKLEKDSKRGKAIIKSHRLKKIIKLPEETFREGVTTSVFIFEAGVPQNNQSIFACRIIEDGLVSVKNQGRQDVYNRWPDIEEQWVDIINKQTGDDSIQWIEPSEHLSYQMPEKPFEVTDQKFEESIIEYLHFKNEMNVTEFNQTLLEKILYSSVIVKQGDQVTISVGEKSVDTISSKAKTWKDYQVKDIFETIKRGGKVHVPTGANVAKKNLRPGNTPRITVTKLNNGVVGCYADNKTDRHYRTYENFISISFLGTVFYQPERASLDMKVHCLKPLNISLNHYTGLFLVAAIKASLQDWPYSDQCSSSLLPNLYIRLPQTKKGLPDWKQMERYMKKKEENAQASIAVLNEVIK